MEQNERILKFEKVHNEFLARSKQAGSCIILDQNISKNFSERDHVCYLTTAVEMFSNRPNVKFNQISFAKDCVNNQLVNKIKTEAENSKKQKPGQPSITTMIGRRAFNMCLNKDHYNLVQSTFPERYLSIYGKPPCSLFQEQPNVYDEKLKKFHNLLSKDNNKKPTTMATNIVSDDEPLLIDYPSPSITNSSLDRPMTSKMAQEQDISSSPLSLIEQQRTTDKALQQIKYSSASKRKLALKEQPLNSSENNKKITKLKFTRTRTIKCSLATFLKNYISSNPPQTREPFPPFQKWANFLDKPRHIRRKLYIEDRMRLERSPVEQNHLYAGNSLAILHDGRFRHLWRDLNKTPANELVWNRQRAVHIYNILNMIVRLMNQLTFQTWHLANLHFIRLLGQNKILPEPNHIFFKKCMSLLTTTKYAKINTPHDKDLVETLAIYPKANIISVERTYLDHLMDTKAKEMETVAKNHLKLNFWPRFKRFYAAIINDRDKTKNLRPFNANYTGDDQLLKRYYRIEHNQFDAFERQSFDRKIQNLPRPVTADNRVVTKSKPTNPANAPTTIVVDEEKKKKSPSQFEYRLQTNEQIKLYYEILQAIEKKELTLERGKKNIFGKKFTILPTNSKWTTQYIGFSNTSMVDLLEKSKLEQFSVQEKSTEAKMLKWLPLAKICYNELKSKKTNMLPSASTESMETNKNEDKVIGTEEELRKKLSEIDWTFTMISTDGRSASVIFQKHAEIKVYADKVTHVNSLINKILLYEEDEDDTSSAEAKKVKTSVNAPVDIRPIADPVVSSQKPQSQGVSETKPPCFVGIDPGHRDLITAYFEYGQDQIKQLPNKHIRRYFNNLKDIRLADPIHCAKQAKKGHLPKKNANLSVFSISSRQFRHLSKVYESRYNLNIEMSKAENSAFLNFEKNMPCNKTSNVAELIAYITYVNKGMISQINFHMQNSTRKWRFKRFCARQQSYDNIAKLFQGCIIGYGNYKFSNRSIIKGERGPIVGLRKNLIKNGLSVITIDEFKTSRLCSNCFFQSSTRIANTLTEFNFDPTRTVEPKFTSAKVLHCDKCKATFDRDVNASINIFNLLKHEYFGIDRPVEFTRQ